jgi:alanine dehydrogenase
VRDSAWKTEPTSEEPSELVVESSEVSGCVSVQITTTNQTIQNNGSKNMLTGVVGEVVACAGRGAIQVVDPGVMMVVADRGIRERIGV